jgi:hypothetical protein
MATCRLVHLLFFGLWLLTANCLGQVQDTASKTTAQQPDSLKSTPRIHTVVFPSQEERLTILAVALALSLGAAILLNEKRKRADALRSIRDK